MNDNGAMPPHLLFVLPWPISAVGGVNQVVENLVRRARKTGTARPILLEYSAAHKRAEPATNAAGTPLIRFRVPVPLTPTERLRSTVSFLLNLPRTLINLRRILQAYRVSVANVHYPTLAAVHFALLKALRVYPGTLVLSFHGLDLVGACKATGIERLAWRYLLASADAIVACSQSLAADIRNFSPASSSRITVIHNGVDPEELLAPLGERAAENLVDAAPGILSIGTFEHKKGHDILLEAFRRLLADFPASRLVLVGRTTPYLAELTSMAARLGIEDRVEFHTDVPHDQVGRFLADASVFCLPSRSEPFGIVVLEAGVFGVPVVASAVGGVTEIVRTGLDGILVPPDDPTALYHALRNVLADPGAGQRRAESLKARVLANFTWDNALRKYLALG